MITAHFSVAVFRLLRKIEISDYSFHHVYLSVRPPAWNKSDPIGRIFMKLYIWVFFENLSRKFKFHQNRTRIAGTLHEDRYSFLIMSCSFLLRMRNISNQHLRENQNTHFMLNNFFRKSCNLWYNVEKYCRAGQACESVFFLYLSTSICTSRLEYFIPLLVSTYIHLVEI